MGKFNGVLIATDYDDTYCPPGGVVPRANLEALDYFLSQGGLFTVATGRAHRTFAPQLFQCPVNVPVILANGAQLYDFQTDRMLVETTVPATIVADLEELMAEDPRISVEAYYGEHVYICNPGGWVRFHLKKTGTRALERPLREMPQPWTKVILENDSRVLLPAQRAILDRWGDRYEAIFSNYHMLEITAKGATKGGMALELSRRLGVRREDLYCVGDNQNDIPMLAVSAVPFAPAGCAQVVKDWGATLLPSSEEGAIAALVDILDRRY